MKLTPYEAPCKGCPDRTVEPNCHVTCPRYQSYRASIDAAAAAKA